MAQRRRSLPPVVRTATGLQPDETGAELRHEWPQLCPRYLTAQDRVAPVIDTVELKHLFRQIDPDTCHVSHVDALLLVVGSTVVSVKPIVPKRGSPSPIRKSRSSHPPDPGG